MNRFRIFSSVFALSLIVLLGGSLSALSAHAQKRGDDIRTADYDVQGLSFPDLRDFDTPEPKRIELDNGMIVFLLEDHELPQVNAVARVGTGSVYEPHEKRGLASLTGTVMRTGGTESMASDSVNRVLEDIGATVETSIGETSGSAFMSTLSDHVDTVLPVFAEILRAPAFAEEKLQQAKSRQRSVISRRNDDAQQIASREFDKILYGENSPYARTPEFYTVDRIEREDLVDFHADYYHPSNVLLSVWGDFEADAMEEAIREHFGDWEEKEGVESPTPPEPTVNRASSVNFIQKDDVNQSTIFMGHPGEITRRSDDYAAVRVMNEVLSGGFSGRLFQNVRREKGLAYSVFGGYSANYDRPGRFYAGVFSKSASTVEAANAVMTEVKRMREKPPTEEELRLAQDSYLNSFVFNFDSKRKILRRLMTYEYYDYPEDFLQQTRDAIDAVDAEDVHRVANEYLYPEESHVLVVGRRQDFSDSLSTLAEDGSVNEIDISIPREPPSEKQAEPTAAEEEAMEKGQALMADVKAALGGSAFDEIEAMRVVTDQDGNESTLVVDLPGRLRTEMSTPMGSVTVVDDGETMKMETPKGIQTAPPMARDQIRGQLWRSLPYLLTNLDHEDLTFRAKGKETVEGKTYPVVEVKPPVGEAYSLFLDPETLRPRRLSLTMTNPKVGEVSVEQIISDYREVNGVTLPYALEVTQSSAQGEQTSTATVQRIELNPELEEGLFTMQDADE